MATYTVQSIVAAGIVPSYAAAASSDKFANNGRTYLHVKNGGGAPITVTIVTQYTAGGLALADQAVSVANGAEKVIGPFPTDLYNDANGETTVTYSATTSVTAGAFSI
jgi:hypothetical protein